MRLARRAIGALENGRLLQQGISARDPSRSTASYIQIGWRLLNPAVPVFETMGAFALANIATNGVCLWLLTRHRHDDVNMSSVYECSRNDVGEGLAVLAAAAGVGWFDSAWPDLLVATALLLMFLVSGSRVLRMAWRELRMAA